MFNPEMMAFAAKQLEQMTPEQRENLMKQASKMDPNMIKQAMSGGPPVSPRCASLTVPEQRGVHGIRRTHFKGGGKLPLFRWALFGGDRMLLSGSK